MVAEVLVHEPEMRSRQVAVAPARRAGEKWQTIRKLLSSPEVADLRLGLELAEQEIGRLGSRDARPLFEMIASIFYLDTLDRPELLPVLDEAINLVRGFGDWVIPVLVDHLESGDVKAQLAVAHALGRIGADSLDPLLERYAHPSSPNVRPFVVYALGKVNSPRVVKAIPLVIEASRSEDRELRDTATRTLGRIADEIPAGGLPEELRLRMLEALHDRLSERSHAIRAKAIRSLGKLAGAGHLSDPERAEVAEICRRLLGRDEAFDWDRAYIVRREAEEALRQAEEGRGRAA